MKAVLAGKSTSASEIEAILREEGFDCLRAETPAEAKVLTGSLPVILISESSPDPFLINDTYAAKIISGLGVREPVVLFLDHGKDTPDYIVKLVLRRAVSVASGKRPVYVLARSVRSGLPDMEKLYAEARSLGAMFVKYEETSVRNSESCCEIIINDGMTDYSIITPLLIDCAVKENEETAEYAKALRLHSYGSGLINADRWFLSPGRTSRRGVFFIDTGLILSGTLRDAVISIANGIRLDACQSAQGLPSKYAAIDAQKCAFCYTCFRVCPHGALEPDSSAAAMKVVKASCDACGICAAICPAKAIEMHGLEPSGKNTTEKGSIIAFCCENSAAIAAGESFKDLDVRTVSIPCGGNISGELIASALKAYDRVLVAVCSDEACKHFDGNKRACRQVEKVRQSMEKLCLDPDRIEFLQISHAMPAALKAKAELLLKRE